MWKDKAAEAKQRSAQLLQECTELEQHLQEAQLAAAAGSTSRALAAERAHAEREKAELLRSMQQMARDLAAAQVPDEMKPKANQGETHG